MSARAAGLALLLVAVAPSLGRGQAWRPVDFAPTGPAREPGPVSHVTHDLVRDRAEWSLPEGVRVSKEAREERRALELPLPTPEAGLDLVRSGVYDPSQIGQVQLEVTALGHARVRARLERDGGEALVSLWAAIRPSVATQVVTAVLPAPADLDPRQRLVLEFEGQNALVRLRTVTTSPHSMERTLSGWLEPDGLVVIGDEPRRAVTVSTTRATQASFLAPRGSVFRCAVLQPLPLAALSAPSRLEMLVRTRASGASGASGEPDQRWVTLAESRPDASQAAWQRCTVPLEPWADAWVEVSLRVRAEGDGPAGWIVADAAVTVPDQEAPLVLLITTDTHRGDHLGLLHEDGFLRTPALDALAGRGVRFEDCLAPTNRTNPSHAALMTGTHPRDTALVANRQRLGPAWDTLAEQFRAHGYRTLAAVSVNHLGHARSGLGQGFDRMTWPRVGKRNAEETAQILEQWLEDYAGEPLFVWLHLFDAHRPYHPPGAHERDYYPAERDPRDPALPDPGLSGQLKGTELEGIRDLDYVRAQYRAEITYLDDQLRRILEHPRARQAVIAFVGDHGEALGDNDIWFAHNELYPAVTRVPLILSWPGGPQGTLDSTAVQHLDVGRTLLDLAGLAEAPFPGRDLVAGPPPDEETPRRRFLLADRGHAAAVQQDQWYLIVHLIRCQPPFSRRQYDPHQVELYDLSRDPGCQRDRVDEEPKVARFLRKVLLDWLGEAQGLEAPPDAADEEYLEELRQLGYLDSGETNLTFAEDDCAWCLRFR